MATYMPRYMGRLSDGKAQERRKIRIGIIGSGMAAKFHAGHYANMPDVEIVAICDVDEKEVRATAEHFGIPNVYYDYRELIQRDDIDAVDIALHNNLHAQAAIDAMRAGKHVYCEKPIAGSYVDGLRMLEAARETGKMLHVQMASIYYNETRAAKALIDAGKLGRIYHGRASGYRRRNRPYVDGYGNPDFVVKEKCAGGALFDSGIYNIVQVLYLMGIPKTERVSGKTYQEIPMDEERREKSGYNVEEFAQALVRFEGNRTMDIIQSWAVNMSEYERSYVLGSEGGVRLNPFGFFYNIGHLEMDATADLERFNSREHDMDENADAYDLSQHHWIAALQGRVPLLPTAEIAMEMLLIGEGVYLSNQLGREVSREEIIANSKSTAMKF